MTKRKNRPIRFICVFPRKFAAKIAFFIGTLCAQVHFSYEKRKNIGINDSNDTKTVSLPLYLLWNIKSYL